ncbi:UNVERIFIED_CONTAM: movement protein [Sesamum latifolium]|uniref:Movement protein n=1 Tax=Sesamum latifolium TaxID=2727402 RepID=A0AAW2TML8_9LAMI
MDLQPSQNNYNEGDRLQTSESLSGFFSRMMVSNKTIKRITRQDSNLSPYDGFRIGGIGRVLNQIGLKQRRHHIIYKVSSGELIFDIHPRIAYNLADQDFSRVLTLHQDFKRKDLMKEGNRPYSITYRIAYALSNTHHSDLFLRKEYIEIPRIFKEFAKAMTPDPIKIPRIGGVDLVIKDHPILERTLNTKTEFSSRMSFSEDRIIGYREKEKELIKIFTPQEIRVDNVKLRCPGGWKEIQDQEFAQQNLFPKEAMETLPVIAGRNFSQKILILNKGIREAKIMIGGAFGTPWFRVKTPPIYFHDTGADILLGIELQDHIVEKIRNFPDVLKDKKHLQSFLGVVNFAGIFIKDLAKYKKDFRPLLKEQKIQSGNGRRSTLKGYVS